MIGIYKFQNLQNGKIYIGQSVDIERRYKDHINRAKNKNSAEYNSSLHCAIRKYGLDNFSFVVLEECNKNLLNEREQYWIKYYNSYKDGYNETTGGNSQEATKKFTDDLISLIQKLLQDTNITYEELHNSYNISLGLLSAINSGKVYHNDKLNYPLRTKAKKNYCSCCGAEISKGYNLCFSCSCKKKRVVQRPTREELKYLIRTKAFTEIAKSFNVSDNAIKKWCVSYNLPKLKKEINSYSDEDWQFV